MPSQYFILRVLHIVIKRRLKAVSMKSFFQLLLKRVIMCRNFARVIRLFFSPFFPFLDAFAMMSFSRFKSSLGLKLN